MKEQAPWHALSKGWTSASKGILLDYMSSWNVLVLRKALAAGHYNVVMSISVSIIIRILIVISTGLFISQDMIFEKQLNMPTKSFSVPSGFDGADVDTLPYLHLKTVVGNKSPYPLGTTANYAFQPFSVPENTSLGKWKKEETEPYADSSTSTPYTYCQCLHLLAGPGM